MLEDTIEAYAVLPLFQAFLSLSTMYLLYDVPETEEAVHLEEPLP